MTHEEALKYFEHRLSCGQCGENTTQRKAFDVAIECIEKQMPKKHQDAKVTRCPACNTIFGAFAEGFKHCPYCGQKIDWSKE